MEKVFEAVAAEHDIKVSDLQYIGESDCSFIEPGAVLYYFNVIKKGHLKFKSTITYMVKA